MSERVSNRLETFAVGKDGTLSDPVITPSAGTTPFGFDFYTANAASATMTGFSIAANGELTRLTNSGVSGDVGAGGQPFDLDMSRNGKFLYVFKNGTGTVGAFAVENDHGKL